MPSYIQNYGFTKTYVKDNNCAMTNEIKWNGNYDGKFANIDLDINDNGNREFVSMKLNNSDLKDLFGLSPVEIPLEKRLLNDFKSPKPMTLEGALFKRKSRKHRKKHNKRKKSKRLY